LNISYQLTVKSFTSFLLWALPGLFFIYFRVFVQYNY